MVPLTVNLRGHNRMDLYLIRHADALPLGERGVTEDEQRPLSEKGDAQTPLVAATLQRQGIQLNLVVTSPLVRARQTAEGVVRHLSPPPEIETCEDLAPGGKPKKLARFLRDHSEERIGLVGHQPDLNILAAWLIGSKKAQIEIAKAGVACISCPDRPRKAAGMLIWLVTPNWYVEPADQPATR
jgi:phosphohistidine phosphatase